MAQMKRLVDLILELNCRGMSDTEIARACDVTVGIVHYVIEVHGVAVVPGQ
jgi:orotate phosphoribosyltransferase-like protein